jgi:hypothetical protein
MLNPSTADADTDDPTIRRCIAFSKAWGFGGLAVVNLFALRATNPQSLRHHDDPVGPDNDDAILDAAINLDRVVCAWGRHACYLGRGFEVGRMLVSSGCDPMALAINKDGSPKHPLYVRSDVEPVRLKGYGTNAD